MKKEMAVILKYAAVVLAVMLFGATAWAADRPSECTTTDGVYTVTPYDGAHFPRTATNSDPVGCAGGWVWDYLITAENPKDMSAITKVQVYIPSLPPNTIEVLSPVGTQRGTGPQAGNKIYGNGIYNGVVGTVTSLSGVSDGTLFSICTDVNSTGTISMAIETAKTLTGCEAAESDDQGPIGGIIGPGFDPSGYVALETDRKLELAGGDGTICIKKNRANGCILYFYVCDTGEKIQPSNSPEWLADGETIMDMGNFDNPICREAIIGSTGSPLTYYGYANGSYYCLGIYDAEHNPVWNSPCSTY